MKKIILFLCMFIIGTAITASAAEVILNPVPIKNVTPTTNTPTVSTDTSTYELIFTRNLALGSSGKDVMALNKIISLELGTTLDASAAFTTNTASNVKKLQEKYATEILIPNGLSSGTGFVGASTRTKLDQLGAKHHLKLSDFTVPIKYVFSSNLKLGSSGDEVSLLKIVLNSDPDTKLVTKSLEVTNVFDLITLDAVNRFQQKYAKEILAPSGLKNSTGTVGPATRKKLNYILEKILESAKAANASSGASSTSSSNYPLILVNTYSN